MYLFLGSYNFMSEGLLSLVEQTINCLIVKLCFSVRLNF